METKIALHLSPDQINELARFIHAENVDAGWWQHNTSSVIKLNLVHSEISEATEAERKDLMDDHLKDRKGGDVELADALIRVLDLGEGYGFTVLDRQSSTVLAAQEEIDSTFDMTEIVSIMHMYCHLAVSKLWSAIKIDHMIDERYSDLVQIICMSSMVLGYDIYNTADEKRKYNQNRADHKPENRAKKGGKKF